MKTYPWLPPQLSDEGEYYVACDQCGVHFPYIKIAEKLAVLDHYDWKHPEAVHNI